MTIETKSSPGRLAFSRTELVVVIAVVVVLMALLVSMRMGRNQELRGRIPCAGNLREIGAALSLYTKDFKDRLPDCTTNNPNFIGSVWPWDLPRNLASEMEGRGAVRKAFYCPANAGMNDDRHWNFYLRDPAPIRVVGYGFLMNGCAQVPPNLWRTNLFGGGTKSASETQLAFDATLSQDGRYDRIRGKWTDRSAHLDWHGRPLGGNILFEDGHAEWHDFEKMQHRIFANAIWDF